MSCMIFMSPLNGVVFYCAERRYCFGMVSYLMCWESLYNAWKHHKSYTKFEFTEKERKKEKVLW